MNVLIIGGSGFVSGTLARTAVEAGYRVWVVTRGRRPLPDGVQALTADRQDEAAFEAAVRGAGVRWDLAADCIGYEAAAARQDVRVLSPLAAHLVFISTDFVFDPAHRTFPQSAGNAHFASEGYGGNKRLCEVELLGADTGRMAWTVVRPCHIYGPGSELGCLPLHGRDPELLGRLRRGEALRLVGGGRFLQQPIFARDLARIMLSAAGNGRAAGRIFCVAGPDIIESRRYYEIIAQELGVALKVEEVPVTQDLAEHPDHRPFMCHRIYDLSPLRDAGLAVPATPIEDGLREHAQALVAAGR